MKAVYIAGPMTGYEDWNFPAFAAVAASLRSSGETVISPHEIPFDDKTDNPTCLRLCLRALLDCESLVLLPGWRDSKGASVEHAVAEALNMPIHELSSAALAQLQEQP